MCTFTERLWSVFGGRGGDEGDLSDRRRNADRSSFGPFLVAHPFLLAIAPIVHLYSRNLNEADFGTVLVFCSGALLMSAVLLGIAWLCLRQWLKAALVVSTFNVLFFVYGWVYDFVLTHEPVRLPYMTWHWVLIICGYTIVITVGVLLYYQRRDLRPLSRFLSSMLAILLGMCAVKIVHHDVRVYLVGKKHKRQLDDSTITSEYPRAMPLDVDSPQTPDVYYIILDGYARADTLKRVCNFDNAEFIEFLRSRGFFVADESCSNYPFTYMSLTSSLNMCYLDDFLPPASDSRSDAPIYSLLADALVPRVFRSKGYRYVHFANLFQGDAELADIVFRFRPKWLLSSFSKALFRTTALRVYEPNIAQEHLYELENIKRVPEIKGPTFTLCHIVAPHSPYVFDRYGNIRQNVPQSMLQKDCTERHPLNDEMKQAYVEQIQYINRRIRKDIDYILAHSPVPPIIIIQGDHGSWFTLPNEVNDESLSQFAKERMTILNAYYVPEKMRSKLTARITPVNSFRLLFNTCFGEHFDLLPEKNMVGWYGDRYNLVDVDQSLHAGADPDAAVARKETAPATPTPR
jgi:hypothetical protein